MDNPKYIIKGDLTKVVEWEKNPRRDVLSSTAELQESLSRVGLQDAIHVWANAKSKRTLLLKGHRRLAAMRALSWTHCAMVVHDFTDEREAFLFLLQDHGHTVSLNNDERIVAAENGCAMGIELGKLADALGVTEGRVQLWLDIAHDLPPAARDALASGAMSMNTAELVLRVAREVDGKQAAEAVQLVLHDPLSGEAMSSAMAKAAIDAYSAGISEVLGKTAEVLRPRAPLLIVVNDRRELYPTILERAGLRLDGTYRRHVNRRTGRRAGEYFEDVLIARRA